MVDFHRPYTHTMHTQMDRYLWETCGKVASLVTAFLWQLFSAIYIKQISYIYTHIL